MCSLEDMTYDDQIRAGQDVEDEETTKGTICPIIQWWTEGIERKFVQPYCDADPSG